MKNITLSLNPSYFCSERCHFCYLTEDQLSNKKRMDLSQLERRLEEVSSFFQIEHIDLYGGEPALLPRPYVEELKSLLSQYVDEVGVNTNFLSIPEWFHDEFFWISVSYDGKARDRSEEVEMNILTFDREISVLSLCSEKFTKHLNEVVDFLNIAKNVISWEIKPYSSNQSNQLGVTHSRYEVAILEAYTRYIIDNPHYEFINYKLIQDSLSGKRNAFSNDHLYLTPNGNYAVLEFDLNDNEYFLELNTIEEYLDWSKKEEERVKKNDYCGNCQYFGRCLTEHYREVKDLRNSCNGFIHLLNFFKVNTDL